MDHGFIQYLCHPHSAAQVWPPLVVSERAPPRHLTQLLLPPLTSVCSYSGFIIYHERVLTSLARSTGTAVTYLSCGQTVYFYAIVAQGQQEVAPMEAPSALEVRWSPHPWARSLPRSCIRFCFIYRHTFDTAHSKAVEYFLAALQAAGFLNTAEVTGCRIKQEAVFTFHFCRSEWGNTLLEQLISSGNGQCSSRLQMWALCLRQWRSPYFKLALLIIANMAPAQVLMQRQYTLKLNSNLTNICTLQKRCKW